MTVTCRLREDNKYNDYVDYEDDGNDDDDDDDDDGGGGGDDISWQYPRIQLQLSIQ